MKKRSIYDADTKKTYLMNQVYSHNNRVSSLERYNPEFKNLYLLRQVSSIIFKIVAQ